MRRYLTEFLGTLFFVLTIALVITQRNPAAPFIIGSALMVVVYMGGSISGAHYNPAVTLALFLHGKMPRADLLPYLVAQLLGSMTGAYFAYILLDRSFAPAPAPGVGTGAVLLVEALFTCLLALVVLNCAARASTKGNSYFGLAIGFTILVAAYAGGAISGGVYNPAVGTGSIIINAVFGDGTFKDLWLYLVGPCTGAIVAALCFKLQGED